MRESIYDEKRREIGWTSTIGDTIHYFTYKHGEVGQFDTRTKQYRRWKCRPGQTMSPQVGMDFGMTDVLYWAEH
ncbi:MAG: hypothetical protein NC218_01635 [Acetobacter sp.]|nr:hypothetical protein [Acetobacter sp.]